MMSPHNVLPAKIPSTDESLVVVEEFAIVSHTASAMTVRFGCISFIKNNFLSNLKKNNEQAQDITCNRQFP